MSLLSLAALGVYRDQTTHGQSINATATLATSPPAATVPPQPADAATGSPNTVDAGSVASYGRVLTAQIPGEALLAYTTLLALLPDNEYEAGRWIIYAASMLVCAAVVTGAYLAQRINNFATRATGRDSWHLPYFPTFAAVFAMGVFGLTVPGSALQQSMNSASFVVVAGCLAVGGGVIMSILAPFLGNGNAAAVEPDLSHVLSTGDSAPTGRHTVTATLTQSGAPVSNRPVLFTVTGCNAGVVGRYLPVSAKRTSPAR